MKLALLGGSFDPIHLGHTAIAECAWREVGLDHVFFVPARQSPFKSSQPSTPAPERCAMIQIALRTFPWASLWTGELERPAPSYSWQTAALFRNAFPGASLYWILGSDQWNAISTWARPDYLARTLTFLVFSRDSPPAPQPPFRMIPLPATHPASSTAIRASTGREFLDPAVAGYIRDRGLYPIP